MRKFTIFNSLPDEGVTLIPRFYINPAGSDSDQEKSTNGQKSHLIPAGRPNNGFFVPSNSRKSMPISLLPSDCMELSVRSSSSRDTEGRVLIGGKSSFVICGDSKDNDDEANKLVLSKEGKRNTHVHIILFGKKINDSLKSGNFY